VQPISVPKFCSQIPAPPWAKSGALSWLFSKPQLESSVQPF